MTEAEFQPLLVTELTTCGNLGECFEVRLARRAGCEEKQHRCQLVGLVVEGVHSTLGNVQKIPCRRVEPTLSVEQPHRSRQYEERFGQCLVEARARPGVCGRMSTLYKPNCPFVDAPVAR